MEKIFRESVYEMIAWQIFNYLSFDDISNTRWLQTNYIKNNTKSFNFEDAIADNNYANILYLINHIPFAEFTFSCAAEFGNQKIMKLLFKNKCPLDAHVFYSAVKNGNIDNMKWLKETGCPMDIWALMIAIDKENLENIKWLIENGCPWHDYNHIKIDNFGVSYKIGKNYMYQDYMGEKIWIIKDYKQKCDNIILYALNTNKLDIAKWLRKIIFK